MPFEAEPSPGDDRTIAAVDGFTATGDTLRELRNFFEHHFFDTAGPYSDLFSVLLSCCKHLVDTSLHHHAVLSAQRQDISHLSSEKEALCKLTARCQEDVRELRSSCVEPQVAAWNSQSLPLLEAAVKSNTADLGFLWERVGDADGRLQTTQTAMDDLQRRQQEFEQQQQKHLDELQRRQKSVNEHINQLEEDIDELKRGISAHAEYIDGKVSEVKKVTSSSLASTAELLPEIKLYADKKVMALKEELCVALQEAVLVDDVAHTRSSPSRSLKGHIGHGSATTEARFTECGDGEGEGLAVHLHRLVSRSLTVIHSHVEQLESRLEVLEVYAPHQCSMAARPPLLGVELRDEKNVGVRVDKVFRGFAGEASGMMPGDVVIAVNGQEVLTRAEMYALMTVLVRENQSRRRLLMQLYFEQHAGQKKKSGAVANEGGHHDVPGRHNVCEGEFCRDKCWQLPQLELRFHLKRGGFLCETTITVDDNPSSS